MLASAITTLGKTVLLVAAVTFIMWSLYTAMVIPKRRPGFPKRLDVYIVFSAMLFIAQMTAVVWVTGTQAVEYEAASETAGPTPEETHPAGPTPEAVGGDVAAGKTIFTSTGCGTCHALADAGTSGAIGPDLDGAKPTVELVIDRVTHGSGAMPPFASSLSETEIADVAAYVSSVAGS